MTDGGRQPRPHDVIRDKLESLGELPGELYKDLTGPASYLVGRDGGMDWTLAACAPCRYVAAMPGRLPRRVVVTWTCPSCGTIYRLEPPLAVLKAGLRPLDPGQRLS